MGHRPSHRSSKNQNSATDWVQRFCEQLDGPVPKIYTSSSAISLTESGWQHICWELAADWGIAEVWLFGGIYCLVRSSETISTEGGLLDNIQYMCRYQKPTLANHDMHPLVTKVGSTVCWCWFIDQKGGRLCSRQHLCRRQTWVGLTICQKL